MVNRMLAGCVRAAGRRIRRGFSLGRSVSSDELQLAIVIPLPDHIAHEVVKLQLSILRRCGFHDGLEAHPHITLKLGYPAADIKPSEIRLEQLASQSPPISIELDGFDAFDEGILFLNVKANPELESLRQSILRDLESTCGIPPLEIEGSGFRFHVTVASCLRRRDFVRLRDEFVPQRMEFQFLARHLELLCHTGAHWVVCRRLELNPQDVGTQAGMDALPEMSVKAGIRSKNNEVN